MRPLLTNLSLRVQLRTARKANKLLATELRHERERKAVYEALDEHARQVAVHSAKVALRESLDRLEAL